MLESRKGFSFACRSSPRVFRSGGKTPVQRIQIDLKHENAIPHIDETVGIPGTTAKERCRMGLIGHQSADRLNVPHPGTLRSGATSNGLAGFWIAPIGQFPIAVDGVFVLEIDLDTLNRRLAARPEDEWGGSASEGESFARLQHATKEGLPTNAIIIDATAPLSSIVDTILKNANVVSP